MIAFSSPRESRCRSTQLTHAFRRPPTHHLKNGGLLVSTTSSHFLSHVSISAYSSKHCGKFSGAKRSRIDRSPEFACSRYCSGGSTYSSSRQWTAILSSEYSTSSEAASVVSAIESLPSSGVCTRGGLGALEMTPSCLGFACYFATTLLPGASALVVCLLTPAGAGLPGGSPGRTWSSAPPRTTRTTPPPRSRCRR